MYRPTVRMADAFQDYIDKLHTVTRLDRNQLIRLAIFAAAYSDPFKEILEEYKKADVPLPFPAWELYEDQFFLEKDPKASKSEEGKGADAHVIAMAEAAATAADDTRPAAPAAAGSGPDSGPAGQVHQVRRIGAGKGKRIVIQTAQA